MREVCNAIRHVKQSHGGVKYTCQCKFYVATFTYLYYKADHVTCLTPVKTHAKLFTVTLTKGEQLNYRDSMHAPALIGIRLGFCFCEEMTDFLR